MKMMIGVTMMNNNLSELFIAQIMFQKKLCLSGKVNANVNDIGEEDDIDNYKYHLIAMSEEFGELVKSDKRWKNLRNNHYNKENKLEELSDVLITFINLCIFSGFSVNDIYNSTYNKIKENGKRLLEEIERG